MVNVRGCELVELKMEHWYWNTGFCCVGQIQKQGYEGGDNTHTLYLVL